MKEANDWRKKYTGAFKKHCEVLIEVLLNKQAYENKLEWKCSNNKCVLC